MNDIIPSPTEVENERQRLIHELAADNGANWHDDFCPGTAGCHELLDRASLFAAWLERDLVNHPACVGNAEWFALAEQAADAVRQLYQRIGAEHLQKRD